MDALLAMPAALFRRWLEFWELEPFGPAQEDLRAGYLCSLWSKKGPADFFPSLAGREPRKRRQTPEDHRRVCLELAAMCGRVKSSPPASANSPP